MLKLFYTGYLKGRNLHSSIINNVIHARVRPWNENVIDILKSIPLAKLPYICEHGQFLDIYPSSEEEHRQINETLSTRGVAVRNNYIDQETDGLVIKNRIIANFVPDEYQPLKSMINPKHYEYFNVPELEENRLLFLNGLTRPYFDEIFDGIHFHKISPPLTPPGVWKLYVANRDHYFLLLSRPYLFGDTLFDQSSLRLPLYSINFKSEQKISSSQIYLYSRSEKLSKLEQIREAIPGISNVYIAKCDYENGNLFIFHIYDRSKMLQVLYSNGSALNGTTEYIMTFGDDITINNICSNILSHSYNPNISHVGYENKTDQYDVWSTNDTMFNPINLKTFKQMITWGVNHRGHHSYPKQFQ
ncbi:hypothetical protein RF11_06649 [Thelohanellus kitauei]|uniref:Uncharacterized protein n=1 Tax=Thelohanellus kitauei TaxID=669202 RepID=A0A0C2MST0_THEKT|nr:hypothetical protein RF11_06649 [Thelohanellus kitauei]